MKVVFGEPDKMFRLIAEAIAPSPEGGTFLKQFYLTECADPVSMLRAWSARHQVPPGIEVAHCARPEELKSMLADADVLVIENGTVGADELSQASSLKMIHTFGRRTISIAKPAGRAGSPFEHSIGMPTAWSPHTS